MSHMVAFIDVHKKVLMVVVGDGGQEEKMELQRHRFGANPGELKKLGEYLRGLEVAEVCMESTAQYWKPVWAELEERGFYLELAQAQSNQGRKGRKSDYRDAERGLRRYLADELILSYVPDPEQRIWRTQARTGVRLVRERARLQNRMEALLEEMRIKLSSVVSELLGVSSTRMLRAVAEGANDPEKLAEMAEPTLQASKAELMDALEAVKKLDPRYRVVLRQHFQRLDLLNHQIEELKEELGKSLRPHADAVERLAEIPGMGAHSAQQIIAELGPRAEKFATAGDLASWVGVCPGENVSAEENHDDHSPKGNMFMRRILAEVANAAVKAKGTVFQNRYRRMVGRDLKNHGKAIWAVSHAILRVVWKVLHDGVRYEERGDRHDPRADQRRVARLRRQLKQFGYSVTALPRVSAVKALDPSPI